MLKHVLAMVVGVVLLLSTATSVSAIGTISSFDSQITINQDTSLSITETIVFETDVPRRGIFRYIPMRYHQRGLNFRARVTDFSVVDEQGQPYRYERSVDGGNVFLKIGDPDVEFTGTKVYVLQYRVENAVQLRDGVQSLIWDITGEGWQIPIAYSSTTVQSPFADLSNLECFSGDFGEDDGLCVLQVSSADEATFVYDEPITYGRNLTVSAVLVEPNQLLFPTFTDRLLKTIGDNVVVGLLAIPGLIMFYWWWYKGRDSVFISANVFANDPSQPQRKNGLFASLRTPMVYEPLKDLTPGEAGAILDERVDNRDVIAELIDLAHLKYLKIERVEKKKLLGSETDYNFTQLKSADDKLTPAQKYLHGALFKGRDSVKLSTLKGSFYTHMSKVKDLIYESLTSKGFFAQNPNQVRIKAFVMAGVMGAISFIFLMGQLNMGVFWAVPVFVMSSLVGATCAWFMPAKTAVGSNYSMQARGLRETIKRGAWREKIKEKHLFIEEVLPFAVALGVIDQLSKDMEKMHIKPPEYVSNGFTSHMTTAAFVSSFTSSAGSTMSYNPSSSSSGGGGAGGGGGGGGGGSW